MEIGDNVFNGRVFQGDFFLGLTQEFNLCFFLIEEIILKGKGSNFLIGNQIKAKQQQIIKKAQQILKFSSIHICNL